ncbi:conserved hypothetical protein [Talaromyces stipitatus ATCC 10500]|uniref:Uncharacterized protein n=1 Tax=Talaromyces stipitatus (strain ATCC 10500 / CBS 375.48 / QM 6759 / NRRL 1006) TaxID=441959 RepID=B8M6H8_TALSN|nr:uncharacterized protein TSTA_027370 [Talaromyces stipitatus ATCC 10500]EED19440.1 conserved hypothetical protein [Talaromyces stipitatus ATCC 10500]
MQKHIKSDSVAASRDASHYDTSNVTRDPLAFWKDLRVRAVNSFVSNAAEASTKSIATSISVTGQWNGIKQPAYGHVDAPGDSNSTDVSDIGRRAVKDQTAALSPHALEETSPWEDSNPWEEAVLEKETRTSEETHLDDEADLEEEFLNTLTESLPHIRHGGYVNTNSLSRILQKYLLALRSQTPSTNTDIQELAGLSNIFDTETLRTLSKKGYFPEDVAAWAWILAPKGSSRAAMRLFLWDSRNSVRRRTPLFVLKILLHRPHLDVRAYRILLSYSLSYLLRQPINSTILEGDSTVASTQFESDVATLTSKEAGPLVTILLKRAREMLPAAQFNIAQAYAFYLIHLLPLSESKRMVWEINRLRAEGFNKCLRLLGIPSRVQPYISASIQQQAQFELLKAMAAHNPVIPVSRLGYQAIMAVQLAHVKTPAERIFAEQKALSWPPWKEARMGIDSERGNEGMYSRAMQVLSQMTEAGYGRSSWDDVAAILAGWDTDGTPTIQTRSLARPQKSLGSGIKESKVVSTIWASRIRATRTLREAWACFLSYESRCSIPSEPVYHAMARKLIYKKESHCITTKNGPLPGDGFEVYPEPSSARDVTYVPTEPPTLEALLERMILQGILPGPDFVALLLRFSPNFSTGLRYIAAFLSPKQTKAISTLYVGDLEEENFETLKAMKPSLFDSIIAFFCAQSQLPCPGHRFRKADLFPILTQRPSQLVVDTSTFFSDEDVLREGNGNGHPQTLSHAVELLHVTRPRRVTAWLPLLRALASPRGPTEERLVKPHVHWYFAWYEANELIRWMQELELEPGMEGFIVLCQVFAQAVGVGIQSVHAADESLHLAHRTKRHNDELYVSIPTDFESFVHQGIRVLKSYFDRLVLPFHPMLDSSPSLNTSEPELNAQLGSHVPDMVQVPTPSALHVFIRALGTAEDHDGILNLLEWMSRYASEIAEASDQRRGGRRMLRRTLTAVRVFLEDLNELKIPQREPESTVGRKAPLDSYYHIGEEQEVKSESRPIFSDGRVEEAYDLIESTAVWGPWPSDDEVRAYVARYMHPDI